MDEKLPPDPFLTDRWVRPIALFFTVIILIGLCVLIWALAIWALRGAL